MKTIYNLTQIVKKKNDLNCLNLLVGLWKLLVIGVTYHDKRETGKEKNSGGVFLLICT